MIDLNQYPPKPEQTEPGPGYDTKPKARRKRSKKQKATSRANGSQSHGPTTWQGKSISSLNAIKHGFCGEFILLYGESIVAYNELHAQFLQRFQPQDAPAYSLVDAMCEITWEIARAGADKRNSMMVTIDEQRDRFNRTFENAHYSVRITRAHEFQLAPGAFGDVLERHIARLERSFDRKMKQLIEINKHFPLPGDSPQQQNTRNEPEPIVTPAESEAQSESQPAVEQTPTAQTCIRRPYQPVLGASHYALIPANLEPEPEVTPATTLEPQKVRSAAA